MKRNEKEKLWWVSLKMWVNMVNEYVCVCVFEGNKKDFPF